jgi:hypothetical protein
MLYRILYNIQSIFSNSFFFKFYNIIHVLNFLIIIFTSIYDNTILVLLWEDRFNLFLKEISLIIVIAPIYIHIIYLILINFKYINCFLFLWTQNVGLQLWSRVNALYFPRSSYIWHCVQSTEYIKLIFSVNVNVEFG